MNTFLGAICPRKKKQSFSSQIHLKLRTMSKAEKFIQDYTRNCSNQSKWGVETPNKSIIYVQPWLTPDDARKAVEIAREEIYEWLANHYRDYMYNPTGKELEAFFGGDMITDLKQAIKDE